MDLNLVIEMVAQGEPRPVVVAGGEQLSADELRSAACGLAQRVLDGAHDSVIYLGGNTVRFPVALFGAARAGVPFIPLNYRLSASQLEGLLEAHPLALRVDDSLELDGLTGDLDAPDGLEDEVAVYLYTSGTTAAPKAAILRHRHLMAYLFGTIDFGSAEETEAALVTVPPYHVAGLTNLLSNLYAGRRIVYLDSFTPQHWIDTCREHGVTQAMVVPTMLARIVDALDAEGGSAPELRSLSYGGARMPLPVLERALAHFGETSFVNAYGLTETSSTIALLGPDEHRAGKHLGSVGQLLPGIELEVRPEDAVAGETVPTGEVGLIFLRGDQISGEYKGVSILDADGWFATRDRGWVTEDGYLYIEGRADDTIIRGGENIAPAEIEDVLLEHPGISDVVVVGVPDDEWGQRIAAVVVAAEGAEPVSGEELQVWAKERLRSSKTPDIVEFRNELPRTDTGKLLRRKVLEELTA